MYKKDFIVIVFIIAMVYSQSVQALINGSKFNSCHYYAERAVEQNRSQQYMSCGFTEQIWRGERKHHRQWCENSPPRKIAEYYHSRVNRLKSCMKAKFDIKESISYGSQRQLNSLLKKAAVGGRVSEVQRYIAMGASYLKLQNSLMTSAIAAKKYDVILLLSSFGTPLSSEGNSPLSSYITSSDPSGKNFLMLRWLLDNGVNPNDTDSTGETPLEEAISYQNERVVTLLLQRGANPNIDINGNHCETIMPLDLANKLGGKGIIDTLIKSGAKPKNLCEDYFSLDIEM